MTKDIETVILPKCETCKKVIEHPHEGYIVVGDIYTAELDANGQPHAGLVGASFPTPDENTQVNLARLGESHKFTYDDVHKHCYCKTCMMEILKIPHRPMPRPGLRGDILDDPGVRLKGYPEDPARGSGTDAVDDAFEKMRRDTVGRSPIEFDEE